MVSFQSMNQVGRGFRIKRRIIQAGNLLFFISATSRVLAASNTGDIRFPQTVTASFTKCLHVPGWYAVSSLSKDLSKPCAVIDYGRKVIQKNRWDHKTANDPIHRYESFFRKMKETGMARVAKTGRFLWQGCIYNLIPSFLMRRNRVLL